MNKNKSAGVLPTPKAGWYETRAGDILAFFLQTQRAGLPCTLPISKNSTKQADSSATGHLAMAEMCSIQVNLLWVELLATVANLLVADCLLFFSSQKDTNRFDRDRLFGAVSKGNAEELDGLFSYLELTSKFLTNSEYTGGYLLSMFSAGLTKAFLLSSSGAQRLCCSV